MFRLFRSAPCSDPIFGQLTRSRGRWRGQTALAGKIVQLALVGSRKAPDAAALTVAKQLAGVWADDQALVEIALFDHYEPYREAAAAGEFEPPEAPILIASPSAVWKYVDVQSVSVAPLDDGLTAEVALSVAWDEEHTLGVRFNGGRFIELNGSILPE